MLAVEDNLDDAHLLRQAFRRAWPGLRLEHVENGKQSVARFADEATLVPAIVLLDLKLPRMSGFEVLGWIRADQQVRRAPVVVLTSSRSRDEVGRSYALGANSYLVKPTAPEALSVRPGTSFVKSGAYRTSAGTATVPPIQFWSRLDRLQTENVAPQATENAPFVPGRTLRLIVADTNRY